MTYITSQDNSVNYPATNTPFYQTINAIWPDLIAGNVTVAPARNGMDRKTGKLLQGWAHVDQSLNVIFLTPFHERVLRRWVGSFVPILLGDNFTGPVVLRFFWAIASAIDLWEPDYVIRRVYFMGEAINDLSPPMTAGTVEQLVRLGQAIFRQEGVYRPRAHLGDYTPYAGKQSQLTGGGNQLWNINSNVNSSMPAGATVP